MFDLADRHIGAVGDVEQYPKDERGPADDLNRADAVLQELVESKARNHDRDGCQNQF